MSTKTKKTKAAKAETPKKKRETKAAKPETKQAKHETPAATPTPATPKKMSCLDAAAQVLNGHGAAMTTGEMIDAMTKAGLWSSPNGKTPAATLYSAILREIGTKGDAARFTKTERGKFAAKGGAT